MAWFEKKHHLMGMAGRYGMQSKNGEIALRKKNMEINYILYNIHIKYYVQECLGIKYACNIL